MLETTGTGRLNSAGRNRTEVIEIVAEQMGVDKSEITRETSFVNDLNADSLDTVELVMEFEDEFELSIPTKRPRRSRPSARRSTTSKSIPIGLNRPKDAMGMSDRRVVVTGMGTVNPWPARCPNSGRPACRRSGIRPSRDLTPPVRLPHRGRGPELGRLSPGYVDPKESGAWTASPSSRWWPPSTPSTTRTRFRQEDPNVRGRRRQRHRGLQELEDQHNRMIQKGPGASVPSPFPS